GIEWVDYVKREITQVATRELVQGDAISFDQRSSKERERRDIPATSEAAKWDGWGTALKPAIEPIILARKPLDGTVANNVLAHGVGGLHIDACRVQTDDDLQKKYPNGPGGNTFGCGRMEITEWNQPAGRFPTNVLLDKQSGVLKTGAWNGNRNSQKTDKV